MRGRKTHNMSEKTEKSGLAGAGGEKPSMTQMRINDMFMSKPRLSKPRSTPVKQRPPLKTPLKIEKLNPTGVGGGKTPSQEDRRKMKARQKFNLMKIG